MKYKFESTHCSQCGQETGPGNSGYSHCEDHRIVGEFISKGLRASYHYADDSTTEWSLGDVRKHECLAIFDANPHLQAKMREQANFLWSLKSARPE